MTPILIISAWAALDTALVRFAHCLKATHHRGPVPTTDADRLDRVLAADGGPLNAHAGVCNLDHRCGASKLAAWEFGQ